MSTISGNHYSGITLTSPTYTNPVTIASGAYIFNAAGGFAREMTSAQ